MPLDSIIELIMFAGFFVALFITFIVMYFLGLFKKDCFLSIKGRMNRRKYLKIIIPCNIATSLIFVFMDSYYFETLDETIILLLLAILFFVISILSIIRFTFVVRRLHDLNYSMWLAVFYIALLEIREFIEPSVLKTIINITFVAASLYLFCAKGTEGTNNYGEDPLLGEKHDTNDTHFK